MACEMHLVDIMRPAEYTRGFTLVEIMIVVAIIGLLSAIGIPSMLEANRRSRSARFGREIQNTSRAFIQYAFENGNYPADKTPAQMPDGMAEYLKGFPWVEKTVIGGNWDWDYKQFGYKAGVSVYAPNWGDDQMQKIDATIDDGNLNTGQFRKRADGYIYIIEE